jgi:hypothetical protein
MKADAPLRLSMPDGAKGRVRLVRPTSAAECEGSLPNLKTRRSKSPATTPLLPGVFARSSIRQSAFSVKTLASLAPWEQR